MNPQNVSDLRNLSSAIPFLSIFFLISCGPNYIYEKSIEITESKKKQKNTIFVSNSFSAHIAEIANIAETPTHHEVFRTNQFKRY